MQTLLKVFALAGLLGLLSGCAQRAVVIDQASDVVRLGPGVKGKVYVWDTKTGAWVMTKRVTLPEGWYAGPGPKE